MGEKTTIQSLISTSVEDDFDTLPLFNQPNFIKRISKQEIQGWSQTYNRQPFQKKQSLKRWRKQSTNQKRNSFLPENFESQQCSPPSLRTIKKQLNNYDEDCELFQKHRPFHTMGSFSNQQTHSKIALPKVILRQSPKEDFVRGVKYLNFVAPQKNRPSKPLHATVQSPKRETERIRCKSVSLNTVRQRSDSKDREIQMISYPLDASHFQESQGSLTKNRLHVYMRKYQI